MNAVKKCYRNVLILTTITFCVSFVYFKQHHEFYNLKNKEKINEERYDFSEATEQAGPFSTIPLVIALCRDAGELVWVNKNDTRFEWERQREQFLTMFASILYLSNLPKITVIIFSDAIESSVELISLMKQWPKRQSNRLTFILRDIEMERFKRKNLSQWRPCAWAKMFLPEMLTDYDSAIYIDTDAVFLGPIEEMLTIFSRMNDVQSIAAAPEFWYIEEGDKRPKGGKFGINTGMLGLNLTRLRNDLHGGLGTTLQQMTKLNPIARHDQDVLNAFLAKHPKYLLEVSPRYNFLPSSCLKLAPVCNDCLDEGILVLHGADSVFHRLVDAKTMVSFSFLIIKICVRSATIIKINNDNNYDNLCYETNCVALSSLRP